MGYILTNTTASNALMKLKEKIMTHQTNLMIKCRFRYLAKLTQTCLTFDAEKHKCIQSHLGAMIEKAIFELLL